jgi:hypothetical protein
MKILVITALIWISLFFEPFLVRMNPSVVFAASSGSTADDLYVKGNKTIQAGTGLLVSPLFIKTNRRDLDYSMTYVRGGYFLTDPSDKKILPRGNLEGIMQVAGSNVTEGFGDYMVEFALLLRYNAVYPGWWIVPYFQFGAGIVYNDLYKDQTQDLVGQSIEFSPQASLGFRYLLGKGWSLDLEGMFHHVSNAGLDDRNVGTNAFGGSIAVTYFFGRPSK